MINKDARRAASARKWYLANREHALAYSAKYARDHPDKAAAYSRAQHKRDRAKALEAYGGKCACCGEDRPQFLTIDHINGDGSAHRARMSSAGGIAAWLRRSGWPKGFRVLCWNCNCALGLYGRCH